MTKESEIVDKDVGTVAAEVMDLYDRAVSAGVPARLLFEAVVSAAAFAAGKYVERLRALEERFRDRERSG